MIYFTSDLHFCHDKEFLYKPRGFLSVQEMNKALVNNWNNVITPEDDVYLLGDVMLNDNVTGIELLKQLKGNIHIILGNHDTDDRVKLYKECQNVVEVVYATVLNYHGYHFYLSHYPTFTAHIDDHPPKRERINLYGHTHQDTNFFHFFSTGAEDIFMYHVGVNSHNNTPVSINEVIRDINEKYKESHPNYNIPELQSARPISKSKLNVDENKLKEKKEKSKQYQAALKIANEVITDDIIAKALFQGNIPENAGFSDKIKCVAPYVYKQLKENHSDIIDTMGDYSGKAVQAVVVRRLKEKENV